MAVGSLGPLPGRSQQLTMEGLEQEAKVMAENIEQAEKVVIIGGGPVGFELAGEIFDKYKQEKKVTIVSSNEKLVSSDFSSKFDASVKYLSHCLFFPIINGWSEGWLPCQSNFSGQNSRALKMLTGHRVHRNNHPHPLIFKRGIETTT